MGHKIRVIILLLILASVVQQAWLEKSDLSWKENFYVAVYPVNVDKSFKVNEYIRRLKQDEFEPMAEFFTNQAKFYHLKLRRPIEVELGMQVEDVPPTPPIVSNIFSSIAWSLKFRYFAWRHSPKVKVKPAIKLYLLYYDPLNNSSLSHSTALDKGRLGRVNLFGDSTYANQNLVILAHELLHTLSATDKYDLTNLLPYYPDGYAEPKKVPRYPQSIAELMGGRIPISETKAEIPITLMQTMIGQKTAGEIGWIK